MNTAKMAGGKADAGDIEQLSPEEGRSFRGALLR